MKQTIDTDTLLRFVRGELADSEADRVQAALAESPDLQKDVRLLRSVRSATAVGADADLLKPFFVDRLQKRLASRSVVNAVSAADEFFASLVSSFKRVSLAAVVLIAVLTAYNVRLSSQYEADLSAAEAVLGLPPVTLATAYSTMDQTNHSSDDSP